MNDSKIMFSNVSFGWQKQNPLFTKLDCIIPYDKVIIMTGENGCGKSTFASLATGLLTPDNGSITIGNQYIDAKRKKLVYKSLSYLQQKTEHNLAGIDAESELNLWSLSKPKDKNMSASIENKLQEWDLAKIKHRPVWELSGGELKRLCIAGLNLFPERYWVMDEPEAELDIDYCKKLISLLSDKAKQCNGALIITHNPHMYIGFADELWQLNSDGTISNTLPESLKI